VIRRILSNASVRDVTHRGFLVALGAALAGAAALASAQDTGTAASSQGPAKHTAHHAGATDGAAKERAELKAKGSYSFGLLMGERLHDFGLNPTDVDFLKFQQGVRAALSGKTTASPADEQTAQDLIRATRAQLAERNEAEAKRFLAHNAKEPGVKSLPSGLQYKVISPGSGASPAPTDEVTVNYRGTFIDGKEFDSSYKRGQPATFTLNRIIRGWQQALVLMKPGAKWDIYIPPELAYGENSPPPIPPGSLLKFEVELLSAKAPAPPRAASPLPPRQ